MSAATLTRRAALSGAVASVAVVASTGTVAMPIAAPADISPGLADAFAAFYAADRAHDQYTAAVYEPLRVRRDAAVAAAEASLPHTTIDVGASDFAPGEAVIWSTANPASVAAAKAFVQLANEKRVTNQRAIAGARRLVAAHQRRKRALDAAREIPGLAEAGAESDRLIRVACEAMSAVGAHPVSTAVDLAAKLAFMVKHEMGDGMDWLEELHADARRIAKMES